MLSVAFKGEGEKRMKISICGCGWLGLPLAKYFVSQGYSVCGSTRDHDKAAMLEAEGIRSFTLKLPVILNESGNADSSLSPFFSADLLVVNVPPGRQDGAAQEFIAKIKSLSRAAKHAGCRKLIFVSTTSVYGCVSGVVTEESYPRPDTASGVAHFELEQWLAKEWGDDVRVLRLAGLIGPGRHPVRFLAGREGITNGSDPVNLVHLDDCLEAVKQIAAIWPDKQVMHLAAPSHPTRRDYYTAMALKAGLPQPDFSVSVKGGGKEIDASHTCQLLGMRVKHVDLMQEKPELDVITK